MTGREIAGALETGPEGASPPPVAVAAAEAAGTATTGESDLAYWRRRERAARESAATAADPRIARIHLAMADAYAAAAAAGD